MTDPITLHPLTPARAGDFLSFFDGDAFADNPKWAGCYCRFPFIDHGHEPWDDQAAAANRAGTAVRIARRGMQGYLAKAEGAVVG